VVASEPRGGGHVGVGALRTRGESYTRGTGGHGTLASGEAPFCCPVPSSLPRAASPHRPPGSLTAGKRPFLPLPPPHPPPRPPPLLPEPRGSPDLGLHPRLPWRRPPRSSPSRPRRPPSPPRRRRTPSGRPLCRRTTPPRGTHTPGPRR
jgi:hypothetical protein